MIVVCVNCNKKFEVNSELIPLEGRNLQCSSCNHVWFFNKGQKETINISETKNNKEISSLKEKNDLKKENTKPLKNKEKKSHLYGGAGELHLRCSSNSSISSRYRYKRKRRDSCTHCIAPSLHNRHISSTCLQKKKI